MRKRTEPFTLAEALEHVRAADYQIRVGMTYNPANRPRHPVAVAYLNDAALLARIADGLDLSMSDTASVPARSAITHAITILRGASKSLQP